MVKMGKKRLIILIIAGIILSGGVIFGVVIFATWGEYKYSNTYYYDPGIPSSLEKVSFSSNVGSINVKYNTTPTNFAVKIDLDIKVSGGFVAGKSFSDFFHPIIWLNESVPVTTFSLQNKPSASFIFPIIQRIIINVTLRTDIQQYDIVASSNTGSINLDIPDNMELNNTILATDTGSITLDVSDNVVFGGNVQVGTSTGSVYVYAQNANFSQGLTSASTTGSLTLNFTNCFMGDDLSGTVSTGSINLKSYNMIYSQNSILGFQTSTGSISASIYQYIDMSANVTGSMITSTGSVNVYYIDNQPSVGASFLGAWSTGSYNRVNSGGFAAISTNPFNSLDYGTATSRYTLSLTTSTGSINVDGTSS